MQDTIEHNTDPRLHVVTLEQQSEESDGYYARRLNDPLESAFADESRHQALMAQSMDGLRSNLDTQKAHEIVELATDISYHAFALQAQPEFHGALRVANHTIKEELATTSLAPSERLHLESRQLDLLSLRAFEKYRQQPHEASDATSDQNVSKLLEAVARDVIRQGARILKESQKGLDAIDDPMERLKLTGNMFELLYITFMRLEAYSGEEHDERLIVGATEFEDSAAKFYKPKNHNFDISVLNTDGKTVELIQCKAGQSNMDYERPIHKVTGKAFARFMKDPHAFVIAIAQLASNDPEISEERMRAHQALLESLFDESERTGSEFAGRVALSSTAA